MRIKSLKIWNQAYTQRSKEYVSIKERIWKSDFVSFIILLMEFLSSFHALLSKYGLGKLSVKVRRLSVRVSGKKQVCTVCHSLSQAAPRHRLPFVDFRHKFDFPVTAQCQALILHISFKIYFEKESFPQKNICNNKCSVSIMSLLCWNHPKWWHKLN